MTAQEIRRKFLEFFAQRGHVVVPSSSLIPDDPSVLLTTAGMQQFKKYYTGEADPIKDFGSKNTVSIQKSFRTSDIDEVGDESHNTFFEMLGNFSFGGYFKKEAITYAHEFITKELGLLIDYVTVFEGDEEVPADEEAEKVWQSLGVKNIKKLGRSENFWGPTGKEGPCGPTTEIYVKGVTAEIWNLVFNEYYCKDDKLSPLKIKGVDTGMGLERLATAMQNKKNVFETDLFAPLTELLPQGIAIHHKRIITDHLRGSTFLLADGVRSSNKEAGYVLRRLMRRTFVYEKMYKVPDHVFDAIIHDVVHEYYEFYPELTRENNAIREEFKSEREKFGRTLDRGIKELGKTSEINAENAFRLYETFGLPFEIIKELGGERAKNFTRPAFDEEFKKHQEISRAGQERKFGGHGLLLDTGELKAADARELKIVTRLHTATHLLNSALRKVLGPEIEQDGSDITALRTRFDFTHPRKLTPPEIKQVEDLVNEAVKRDLKVEYEEMPYREALQLGALHFFRDKYPSTVKVYTAYDPQTGEVFSQELCGGPHVTHTGEIGHFKIIKEESSSAGVRRIRAVVE